MFDHVSLKGDLDFLVYHILVGEIEYDKCAGTIKRKWQFQTSLASKLEKSCSRRSLDKNRQLDRY